MVCDKSKKIQMSSSSNDRVLLNVGGTRYETTRSTLCKMEGLLLGMFGGSFSNQPEDYFIDRNGRLFEAVLVYLQVRKIVFAHFF